MDRAPHRAPLHRARAPSRSHPPLERSQRHPLDVARPRRHASASPRRARRRDRSAGAAPAGEVQQERGDDAGVDEQGLTRWNRPVRTPSSTMAARVLTMPVRSRGAVAGVEVSAALGDLRGTRSAESAGAPRPRRRWPRRRRGSSRPGRRLDAATPRTRAADGAEHVAEDLAVERRLAAEVVVDHRLVEAGGAGDAVDAGAGEATGGELGAAAASSRRARPPSRVGR